MAREECHPDRSGYARHAISGRGQLRQRLPHGLGDPHGPDFVGVVKHQEELLASVANGRVAGPKRGLYRATHVAEQGVSGHVPALVVHALEVVEIDQQDPHLSAGSAGEGGLARRQLVPPAMVEKPGQDVGHRTQLELGIQLRIPPGGSGDVTEERTTLEIFLGELGPAVAPHVDDTEPVVTGLERYDEQGLLQGRLALSGDRRGCGVAASVRAVVGVAAEECPTRDTPVDRNVHFVEPLQRFACEDAWPEPVSVPVGFEDREAVGTHRQRQVLSSDLKHAARIVLGQHAAGDLPERPGETLGIDRQFSGGRKLGDEGRGIERFARRGEHPHSLLAEPGRRDDLVARLCRRGAEHGRRSQMRADPQSHAEPDQAAGNGVVGDAARNDMSAQPSAVCEQAGELCLRPDARRDVVLVRRIQDHEARHEVTDDSAAEHARCDVVKGDLESLIAQLGDPPLDKVGQLQRRRLGNEPCDLSRCGSDFVGSGERVESIVFEEICGQRHEEQRGTRVLDRRECTADELFRVMAHRPAGEGLVGEHRAVLEVHHRLERNESGEVGRILS